MVVLKAPDLRGLLARTWITFETVFRSACKFGTRRHLGIAVSDFFASNRSTTVWFSLNCYSTNQFEILTWQVANFEHFGCASLSFECLRGPVLACTRLFPKTRFVSLPHLTSRVSL